MTFRPAAFLIVVATLTVALAACGGNGSSSTTQPISLTFASQLAPPASMTIGNQAPIAVTITNGPRNATVNWTATCASAQCGSFTPTSTASGGATQYKAPTAVPAGSTVTITATSITDSSKFASATVTTTSDIGVVFTPTFAPPDSMNTNIQVEIAAYTTSDPANAGVNWTVTCGSAQCGSFDPTTPTNNNVPVTYTAPLTVPAGNTVTVTATSVSDFTKSVSGTITIGQPPASLPDGTYVFQLSGEDSNQQSPFNIAGAFTVQSGAIIGGEQDFVDLFSGPGSDGILRDTSTVNPTADGNLQIVLDTSDSNIGVGGDGLETLNVALVTSSTGLVTWFDGFAAGNGTIALQDPTAAQALPQYGYAFVTSGTDNNVKATPVVMGGIINVDDLGGAGTISGAGSVLDFNDGSASAPEPDQPLAASTVAGPSGGSTPDQYGKVVFTLNPSASPAVPEIALAGYIIDSNTIALVETADDFGGTTGGTALAQGQANTGSFSTANLSGSSYVVGAQGADNYFFLNFVGALTFNSDGSSLAGTADFNDQNTESSGSVAGTYSVDSTGISAATGRVTITNFTGTDLNFDPNTDPAAAQPATLQLYLDGNGNALLASMDQYDFTAGPAFQQTAASLSGSYALSGVGVSATTLNTWSAVGPINIGSDGAIGSGSFTDFNYFAETLSATECGTAGATCADVPLTGTASTPSGTITGLDADTILTPPLQSNTFDFYVIDGLRAFGIETDLNTQTGLLYLQSPATPEGQTKTHK